MANIPYGMTALFESIKHSRAVDEAMDTITDVMCGISESFTYDDAVAAGFMSDDDVENDMDVEDEVDIDDSRLAELCDKIDPIDDEDEIDIDELDGAIESFIDENFI